MKRTEATEAPRNQAPQSQGFTRRDVMRALALLPLGAYLGCGGSSSEGDTEVALDGAQSGDLGNVPWATGGTASMKDKASYPNPFAGAVDTTCPLTCEIIQGPCWDSASQFIQDISYGYTGLPMRMYFRLVDEKCQPVAGAVVDTWHVSPVGKYSGDDAVNEQVSYCTGDDSAFTSKLYFRGKQTSDSNGVLFFDTCFPGWYSMRSIHVHIIVSVNGASSVTTQLFFADALDDEIVDTQPVYDTRGKRDTTNETDVIIAASAVPSFLFQTQKLPDGALLAWKTIVLRSAAGEQSCTAPGGVGSFGDGGFPDGGFPDGGFPDGGFPDAGPGLGGDRPTGPQ